MIAVVSYYKQYKYRGAKTFNQLASVIDSLDKVAAKWWRCKRVSTNLFVCVSEHIQELSLMSGNLHFCSSQNKHSTFKFMPSDWTPWHPIYYLPCFKRGIKSRVYLYTITEIDVSSHIRDLILEVFWFFEAPPNLCGFIYPNNVRCWC